MRTEEPSREPSQRKQESHRRFDNAYAESVCIFSGIEHVLFICFILILCRSLYASPDLSSHVTYCLPDDPVTTKSYLSSDSPPRSLRYGTLYVVRNLGQWLSRGVGERGLSDSGYMVSSEGVSEH